MFSGSRASAERVLIRGGTALVSLGVVGFAFAMPADALWAVILCAVAQGAGFGMMWGFVVRRILSYTPAEEKDVASSSIPTVQQIAFAICAAAAGIVANMAGFADGVSLDSARAAAYWVFIAFVPLAAVANAAAWKLTR